jgi:glucokinase
MKSSSHGSSAVVADIGGTNARFGWLRAPGAPVEHVRTLAVRDFPGPAHAVQAYLASLAPVLGAGEPGPSWAAFAVATPVSADEIAFTNSPWRFSRTGVQAELGLRSLCVLNDFEALALALPHLDAGQYRSHGAAPRSAGGLAVVGPGTGLGVAGVLETAQGWVSISGEGGHASLAPADAFESALLASVRQTHPHVSAERLLSGIGLPVLRNAVADVLGAPRQAMSGRDVVEKGLGGTDELCSRTLDVFCAMLGGFAGNVALMLGARGGVFIGGGIVPRLGERFFASDFRERFEAKGRLRGYLEAIPTAVITDTLAALGGAARAIGAGEPQPASTQST